VFKRDLKEILRRDDYRGWNEMINLIHNVTTIANSAELCSRTHVDVYTQAIRSALVGVNSLSFCFQPFTASLGV
jgi:hypothetical protein